MASEDKQAHLETLLTQSENEVNLLQFAMKKVKKEYDQNLADLTKKVRDYESRELEFAEFKRSSSQRNQEMELLKTKNDKLEAKIKEILTSEAAKISQTLSRNQVLEKENLELHTVQGNLEEKIREISSQISHYKNLNEAHEKYQVLTKKNISKLEEQLEKSNNELNELRKKHANEISLKSEEVNLLRLKIEEYANNNKLLKQHLEQQKQDLMKEHGAASVLEDRSKLRPVEEIRTVQEPVSTDQSELVERNNELRNLVNQYKTENGKISKKLAEAENTIAELRKNIDAASLRELETRKMQYEIENDETARKDSSESFKVPLLHKDRIIELTRKCIEYEQRYFKVTEDNKRLEADLNRIKYEKNLKASEVVKGQQDEAKDNFSLLISKLQQAISKNKSMNDELSQLKKDLEQKDKDIKQVNEEVNRYMSKIRTLTVENSTIKTRIRALDPTYTSQPLSREEIDTIKDEELKVLREKVQSLNNELQNNLKNTVNSQALNQLQHDYEIVKKELQARNEMIDSLSRQIQVLREANALSHMVSSVEAAGHGLGQSRGMQVEQDEEFAKQVSELVQKRFEFEETKQKLEQENQGLQVEKKNLLKRVLELEKKVRTLENQNKEYVNQVGLLEKEKNLKAETIVNREKHLNDLRGEQNRLLEERNELMAKVGLLEKEKNLKAETIVNREKHLNDLRGEQNRLLEERNELMAKVGELEEIREKYVEKIRFYEDYTNQVNQINSDVIGDKELYLKMILNQKNDLAVLEKHYQAELEKVRKEREEFREQFVKLNNERADVMKKHHEATLGSRLKLENQSIIIANSMKKVSQLEEVITELERQLNDYMVTNAKDFSQELPKLSDLSEILDKSRLTIEDYKNFEAVRELISQQKSKYEDSNKFLENTIETLSQKYFALEETYLNEKRTLEEQVDKLKQEALDIINRYENRLREQEELARARENKLKAMKKAAQPAAAEGEKEAVTGMEVEAEAGGEGELPEDLLEREDMENDMENLRRELNNEKGRREKLERELTAEKERVHKNEEEKTRLRRGETELESEKVSLSRKFTLKEVSWIEQRKQYIRQIEEFREEEKEKVKKIAELTDKVEVYESQLKKEDIANIEARQKELSSKVQKLEQENLELKKTLKEKEEEQGMEEEEEEGEGEEEQDTTEEVNKLKQEVEELRMKVAVLEDVGMVKEEAGATETGVSEDQSDILQELRKAIDSGSLIDVLERARSLLVTMSQNKLAE